MMCFLYCSRRFRIFSWRKRCGILKGVSLHIYVLLRGSEYLGLLLYHVSFLFFVRFFFCLVLESVDFCGSVSVFHVSECKDIRIDSLISHLERYLVFCIWSKVLTIDYASKIGYTSIKSMVISYDQK